MILRSAPLLLGGSDSRGAYGRSRWLRPCTLTPGACGHGRARTRGRLSTHQCNGAEPSANDLDCGRRVVLSRAAPTLRSVETHRRAVRSCVCASCPRAQRVKQTPRAAVVRGVGLGPAGLRLPVRPFSRQGQGQSLLASRAREGCTREKGERRREEGGNWPREKNRPAAR